MYYLVPTQYTKKAPIYRQGGISMKKKIGNGGILHMRKGCSSPCVTYLRKLDFETEFIQEFNNESIFIEFLRAASSQSWTKSTPKF